MDTRTRKIDKNSHFFYISSISENEFLSIKRRVQRACVMGESIMIGPCLFNYKRIGSVIEFMIDPFQFVLVEGEKSTIISLVDDVFLIKNKDEKNER